MTDPGPPPYGQPPYGPPPYGPPPYGQPPYGQPPYGPPPYGPPPYGPPPYGRYGYPPIDKPIGWFIVNWIFFWPTAIYSLIKHWTPMDQAAYAGDVAGARMHAAAIRRLGIWALCISLTLTVLYLVVFIAIISSWSHDFG